MHEETMPTDPETNSHESADGNAPLALALVVAWSSTPGLIGRAFVVPPASAGGAYVLGRGPAREDDDHPRLLATEDRPDEAVKTLPLDSRHISRVQCVLRPLDGSLLVDNAGQCRLFHNGEEKPSAQVRPHDILRLGRQLLLICVRRPAWLARMSRVASRHEFGHPDRHGLVGESPAIWSVRRQIALAAARREHVLIAGESGTGKEVVAHAIHATSPRSHFPIVARNAATFPETLIDAELFGNAKNYPNPGMPDRPGLFGLAHHTTLFLDEIAEMPAGLQSHLLRVLDAGEYQRLGESAARRSDFRFIGATNRAERLRPDLAARLKLRIELPGLGERQEDIPLLAHHFLRRMAAENASGVRRFFPGGNLRHEPSMSIDLVEWLVRRKYATHLRELEGLLWRAIDQAEGATLDVGLEVEEINLETQGEQQQQPLADPVVTAATTLRADTRNARSDDTAARSITSEQVLRALKENDWVVQRAWRPLGLRSRHALNRLIVRFGLRRPDHDLV